MSKRIISGGWKFGEGDTGNIPIQVMTRVCLSEEYSGVDIKSQQGFPLRLLVDEDHTLFYCQVTIMLSEV